MFGTGPGHNSPVPSTELNPSSKKNRRVVRRWGTGAALALVAFTVFALTSAQDRVSTDVWATDFAARQIGNTGSPSLEGVDNPLDSHPLKAVWVVQGAGGHEVIGRAPGVVAAAIPAYWIAHPATMTLLPGGVTAAVLVTLALALLYLSLVRLLPGRHAVLAVAVLGFTTPLWSVAANGVWPHTVTAVGIAGMAWASARNRWWLVGVFGGIALWGRLHAALIVAVLALGLAIYRRNPRIALVAGSVSSGFLALLCVWDKWMYGTFDPTASYHAAQFVDYAQSNRFSVVNQLGFWISPDRGILIWTPVLIVLLPAVARRWRELPDWSRLLLVSGLVYTVAQGALNRFSGGDGFYGYRLGLEFLVCAAPALALSVPAVGPIGRALLGPVLGLQFGAIMIGAVTESFYVPPEKVWTANALVRALLSNPAKIGLLLCTTTILGILAQRVWMDPDIRSGRSAGVVVER
jgi:hypothetical protein